VSPTRYFRIFAALSAILLIAPLRTGDLAGYDDAGFALIAKNMALSGDWLNPRSGGYPALEHPPLTMWMQAAIFSVFGFSDFCARLPSALCGLGTILLTYWLARRLLADSFLALLAMFVMASSVYFVKYAARAMTDVPCTFFFVCAICAWLRAQDSPRWYFAAALFTGLAQLTREGAGLLLPAVFVLHLIVSRRRPPLRYAGPALALAFLPLAAWNAYQFGAQGGFYVAVHSAWIGGKLLGGISPAWRRYTGALEYAWMLAKSYWPWLPALIAGIVAAVRNRDRRLSLPLIWAAVVFVACAAIGSRVLRYMLPAYPAFAVFSAFGLSKLVPERHLRGALRILTPIAAAGVLAAAVFPRAHLEAADIRPIALAAAAAPANQRVVFYDAGQPRWDEMNQLQWYGSPYLTILLNRDDLLASLRAPGSRVYIVDADVYHASIEGRVPCQLLARSGRLVCLRSP
jgi:4-amino-4-deoxy-L-arabinose transferase-like glycosyltransferase